MRNQGVSQISHSSSESSVIQPVGHVILQLIWKQAFGNAVWWKRHQVYQLTGVKGHRFFLFFLREHRSLDEKGSGDTRDISLTSHDQQVSHKAFVSQGEIDQSDCFVKQFFLWKPVLGRQQRVNRLPSRGSYENYMLY